MSARIWKWYSPHNTFKTYIKFLEHFIITWNTKPPYNERCLMRLKNHRLYFRSGVSKVLTKIIYIIIHLFTKRRLLDFFVISKINVGYPFTFLMKPLFTNCTFDYTQPWNFIYVTFKERSSTFTVNINKCYKTLFWFFFLVSVDCRNGTSLPCSKHISRWFLNFDSS